MCAGAQFVFPASLVMLFWNNVSSMSYKSCTLLWHAIREKYAAKYLFFYKNVFPQAYLIWVPKLAVLKIGIPLSKRGPEMPPACKASFGIT